MEVDLEIKYLQSFQIEAHRNTHNWPSKHHIKQSNFTAWRKLIKWIFPVDNYKLHNRLGKWREDCRWLEEWDLFVNE